MHFLYSVPKTWLAGALLWLLALGTARADQLTIYHIGVGQGDATLIVAIQANPDTGRLDTVSVLIDAGNAKGKGVAVFEVLQTVLGKRKHLNAVIVSHLHSDHLGGMAEVLSRLYYNDWELDAIIDRGVTAQPLDDECYSDSKGDDYYNDPIEPVDLPGSTVYKTYLREVKRWVDHWDVNSHLNIPPGTELFSWLLKRDRAKMPIQLWCVASNSYALDKYQSTDYTQYPPHDENDYSYAFLLNFQGFQYFTGGDIGGGGGGHGDGETPLAKYFSTFPNAAQFHFCNFKVSHHGSAYSTNPAFLSQAKPSFVVIPSALRSFSGTQIPTLRTVTALRQVCQRLFPTYVSASLYSGSVSQYIDVALQVTDPGFDKNIQMVLRRQLRSKASPYSLTGSPFDSTLTCTQPHPRPAAQLAQTATAELLPLFPADTLRAARSARMPAVAPTPPLVLERPATPLPALPIPSVHRRRHYRHAESTR